MFVQLNAGVPYGAYTNDADADTVFEPMRQALDAGIFQHNLLVGGSRLFGLAGTGYKDLHDAIPINIPSSVETGGVFEVDVALKCEDVSTSLTPRVYNVTDAAAAVTGSPSTSTAWAVQTLTFTPVVGKTYVVQAAKGDDNFNGHAIAYLRRKAA